MTMTTPTPTQNTTTLSLSPGIILCLLIMMTMMIMIMTVTAGAQDISTATVSSNAIAEQNNSDEIDRLTRGLHGMTMTFIQFAEEHEVDAYETGRWTGTFLSRNAGETFNPQEFLEWMKDELAMFELHFEVLEKDSDIIEARRERILTREKLPYFYRYKITLDEYEAFYHGALTEIAKAYGISYSQTREGDSVRLTIREGEGQSD